MAPTTSKTTHFGYREIPEADKPKQISINAKPKKLIKAA